MSKTKKKAIWIGIAIAIILILLCLFLFTYPENCTVYTLSPEACEFFYGCTPQEYDDRFHGLTKVDDQGNLIEKLYPDSKKSAISWYESYIESFRKYGVQISQDYSELYYEGKNALETIGDAEEMARYGAIIRLYNGESGISCKITVKDIDTGEITTRERSANDYSYVIVEFSSWKDYYDFVINF